MTDDNLKQKAQELRADLEQSIRKFTTETGIIPGIDIVIKTEWTACSKQIEYIQITINANL